jgi:hypothetical protein
MPLGGRFPNVLRSQPRQVYALAPSRCRTLPTKGVDWSFGRKRGLGGSEETPKGQLYVASRPHSSGLERTNIFRAHVETAIDNWFCTTASYVFEGLREIRNQVLYVLDTDRYADQGIRQTDLLAQLARDARMRHRGRMRDQRFGAA